MVASRSLSMSHASSGASVRFHDLFSFTRRCSSGSQYSSLLLPNRAAPRPASVRTKAPLRWSVEIDL